MKTNEEIRTAAVRLFDATVIASYNDQYGEDDGSMNIGISRLMKAVAWAKANGEYEALKTICRNRMTKSGWEMARHSSELFEVLFID